MRNILRRPTYVAAASVAIVLLVAGGWAAFGRSDPAQCGGASVAGGMGSIGGPFSLVSETGAAVTDADVIDRPALVYFGYTFCPDVCPFDAVRNADAVDLLAERGHDVRPVFVTVDPERDTPEVLADFTEWMHPEMIGLTGSQEQVRAAAQAYRVFFNRQQTEDEFYLVDHSTFTYLVLPEAGVVDFFRRDAAAEEIAERTACVLASA